MGRYLSSDPVGVVPDLAMLFVAEFSADIPDASIKRSKLNAALLGGLNHPFVYARNNTLRFIDPRGLDALPGISQDVRDAPNRPRNEPQHSYNPLPESGCEVNCRASLYVACVGLTMPGIVYPPSIPVIAVTCNFLASLQCKNQCNPSPDPCDTGSVQ